MPDYQLIIIGGGLSGLAAGIRAARFGIKTLILEQHALPGGLNSYYVRQGHLLETGLHAMTNYAHPGDKQAPLNRLLRQLRLSRKDFPLHAQLRSEIRFNGCVLSFSNDPALLEEEIARVFPERIDCFRSLRRDLQTLDPFAEGPWHSARAFLSGRLRHPLLEDMLLLPLMLYGNAEEEDMDLRQFAIMFRAVFEEGFFRPGGTMREVLDLLTNHYRQFGGELRCRCPVAAIITEKNRTLGVRLADGEELSAAALLSTAGIPETIRLSGWDTDPEPYRGRMSFMENLMLLPRERAAHLSAGRSIIFYHQGSRLAYRQPDTEVDTSWGVLCFPDAFSGLPEAEPGQIRITNPASYPRWQAMEREEYNTAKKQWNNAAIEASEKITGPYQEDISWRDNFTPLTIERFTRKARGAVYGSPVKLRDGTTPWPNLFIAGTDQGYLGIVGAMLSGIVMVNRHLLH